MTQEGQRGTVSDRAIVAERTLRARPGGVFAELTDSKLVERWWAAPGSSMRVEQMDVRPGGKNRYVQRAAEGSEVVFIGSYLEESPPTHLSYAFEFKGQGRTVTTTVELHGEGSSTRVTLTHLFASKEDLEMRSKYGAEAGTKAALPRLAGVVEAAETRSP